jgi:acyl-CoA hydrolase
MVIGVRVESENIQTGETKHCNSSYFTMVAKDENGKNALVPGLILDTEQSIRRFARSIARQAQARHRSSRFNASDFKIEEHMEIIKTQNAQVDYSF